MTRLRIGISMNYHLSADGVERAYLDTPYFEYVAGHGGTPCPIVPIDFERLTGDGLSLPTGCTRPVGQSGGTAGHFNVESYFDEVLGAVDAMIFTGGLDLDPALWGEATHAKTQKVHARRQRFDFLLYEAAAKHGLPMLMICLGAQVLCAAHGGKLCQHLPDRGSSVDHGGGGKISRHPITVRAGSRLARILKADQVDVNSTHHQGVIEAGSGLAVGATATDGVIEALERPECPFLIGVQWHPEKEPFSEVSTALIAGLMSAACSR